MVHGAAADVLAVGSVGRKGFTEDGGTGFFRVGTVHGTEGTMDGGCGSGQILIPQLTREVCS